MNSGNLDPLDEVFLLLEDFESQLEGAVADGEIDIHKKWELLSRKREDLLLERFGGTARAQEQQYGKAA